MSTEQPVKIQYDGISPSHFTQIPNMAIHDLKPNAYKLLAIYLDIAATGEVYAKNSTIAERLGTSVNTMKTARKELADKGYILYSPGKSGKNTTTAKITVKVSWMWEENYNRMSDRGVSNSDRGVSNIDTLTVSNSDTIKQELYNKQELYKDSPSEALPPETVQEKVIKLTADEHSQFIELLGKDFNLHGGRVWDIYHQLRGTIADKKKSTERYKYGQLFRDKPVTLFELKGFAKWYKQECVGCDFPISAASLEDWFGKYRTRPITTRPGDNFFMRKAPTNIDMLNVIDDKAVS